MSPEMIDPQGYSDTATVYNRKKFYPGRALRIEGVDGEGEPIAGNYLIKSVRHDKMIVIDSDNKEVAVYVEWLLTEVDHDEEYEPSVRVELFGHDLA